MRTPGSPGRQAWDDFAEQRLALGTWMSFAEAAGKPFPVPLLIKELAAHNFRDTYLQIARLASVAANSPGGPRSELATELTTDLLRAYSGSLRPIEALVADFVEAQPRGRVVLHEQVAYMLLAMAILYAGDHGPPPSPAKVAWWLLAANDHLPSWNPDARVLDQYEDAAAELWRATRYNHGNHSLRDLVRGVELFRTPPSRGPLAARWEELQLRAFGMPYDQFAVELGGPLTLLSSTWGHRFDTLPLRSPVLKPIDWCAGSESHARFFSARTWTREQARAHFASSLTPEGLPRAFGEFRRRPFMLDGEEILVASPWPVRESLSVYAWAGHRGAEEELTGTTSAWLPGFGDLVEGWCRRVAADAAPGIAANTNARILMSSAIGSADEFEDVILTDGKRVALFAVKGSLAPAKVAATECAKSDVVDWLERFFFAKPDKGRRQRGGAVRLLDAKVRRVHGGAMWPDVEQGAFLIPVIVTFEHFGDNLALNSWLARRCRREHLLQQTEVRQLNVMTVAEFELAMSIASSGGDLLRILGRWRAGDEHVTSERLLSDAGATVEYGDLPLFRSGYAEFWNRAQARLQVLFGGTETEPQGAPASAPN